MWKIPPLKELLKMELGRSFDSRLAICVLQNHQILQKIASSNHARTMDKHQATAVARTLVANLKTIDGIYEF
jgi:hypothetical protein